MVTVFSLGTFLDEASDLFDHYPNVPGLLKRVGFTTIFVKQSLEEASIVLSCLLSADRLPVQNVGDLLCVKESGVKDRDTGDF